MDVKIKEATKDFIIDDKKDIEIYEKIKKHKIIFISLLISIYIIIIIIISICLGFNNLNEFYFCNNGTWGDKCQYNCSCITGCYQYNGICKGCINGTWGIGCQYNCLCINGCYQYDGICINVIK